MKLVTLSIIIYDRSQIRIIEKYLKTLLEDPKLNNNEQLIYDYTNLSGNNTVNFTITFSGHNLQKLIKSGSIEQKLKLTTSLSTSNMYLHNLSSLSVLLKASNFSFVC